MALIKGTNVASPVVPFDTTDVHPSHEAFYGKGGYRTVATTTDRDAIPAARREAGMLVYVVADSKIYTLAANLTAWSELNLAGVSSWNDLADKPSTFPPASHNHDDRYYTETEIDTLLAGKQSAGSYAATVHQHTIADVTGLETALNSKATPADISTAVASLVNSAPAALDTLNELAAALGNDASFATTVTNALAGKAAASHTHGSITSDGKIGTASNRIVVTTTGGSLTTATNIGSNRVITDSGTFLSAIDNLVADVAAYGLPYVIDGNGVMRPLTHTHTASAITDFSTAALAAVTWSTITGKPSTFTPTSHTHAVSDLTQSGATTNQVIAWNGTAWAPANAATGSGTVTSVGLSLPSIFTVSNSPVTGSGTLTGALATQSANVVFAGPTTGAAAAPTFRSLVSTDLPSLGNITNAGAIGSTADRIVVTGGSGVLTTAATIGISQVSGLQTALDGKQASGSYAAASHTHAPADVTFASTDRLLGRSSAGSGAGEEITCTAAGRNLLSAASASLQRDTLGLTIGTQVQAWSDYLDSMVVASTSADNNGDNRLAILYWNGGDGIFSFVVVNSFMIGLLDDTNSATARNTLGLGTAAVANTPTSGNATSSQVVLGNDTRLLSDGSRGDITIGSSGATFSINAGAVVTADLADASVTMPKISATGNANNTTFLRGDGAWATPSGGSGSSVGSDLYLWATFR